MVIVKEAGEVVAGDVMDTAEEVAAMVVESTVGVVEDTEVVEAMVAVVVVTDEVTNIIDKHAYDGE